MTLRELSFMAYGRMKSEWTQTASILAMIFNAHCVSKKSDAKTAHDFMPFGEKKKRDIITDEKEIDRIMTGIYGKKEVKII